MIDTYSFKGVIWFNYDPIDFYYRFILIININFNLGASTHSSFHHQQLLLFIESSPVTHWSSEKRQIIICYLLSHDVHTWCMIELLSDAQLHLSISFRWILIIIIMICNWFFSYWLMIWNICWLMSNGHLLLLLLLTIMCHITWYNHFCTGHCFDCRKCCVFANKTKQKNLNLDLIKEKKINRFRNIYSRTNIRIPEFSVFFHYRYCLIN